MLFYIIGWLIISVTLLTIAITTNNINNTGITGKCIEDKISIIVGCFIIFVTIWPLMLILEISKAIRRKK